MTWRELLKPVLSDGDDYQQQMRLLTTMYGLLIAAGIILGALSAVFTPEPFWRVPTFQGGALFSLVAVLLLALGRSGRPALANLLLGIYGSGLILAFSMIISPNVLYYLTVIVLFASIFISVRLAAGLLTANTLGVLLVGWALNWSFNELVSSGPLAFNLIAGLLTLLIVRYYTCREARRRAQLQAGEARYRALHAALEQQARAMDEVLSNTPEHFVTFDREGRFQYANAAALQAAGLTLAEVVGKTWRDLGFSPVVGHAFEYHLRQMLAAGQPCSWEMELPTRQGVRRFESLLSPLHDAAGSIVGGVLTNRDITNREQTEAALRASEERYRIISDLISDYAYSYRVDPDGHITTDWITDSFSRVTGYTSEEIDAKGTFALYHPDDRPLVEAHVEQVLRGEATAGEYRIITASGEVRWLRIDRRPIWDEAEGRVVRFYGVAQDITERKRAEAALRDSEERYRIVSELISDYAFCYRIEPDGSLVHEWNTDSFQRLTGYTLEDWQARGLYSLYHPDEVEIVRQEIAQVSQGIPLTSEHRIRVAGGQERWMQIYRRPIWDEAEGRVVRFYGVVQDITARKQAEEQKLRLAVERERMTLMSQFVMAISHEFRTLLATIETNRYLIARGLDAAGAELQPKLERIHYSVQRMVEQLENLHAFSLVSSPDTQPCDINALVESIVRQETARLLSRQQRLVFEPSPGLLPVQANTLELGRALRHLLRNAHYHAPAGSAIQVRTDRRADWVGIEVQDSGSGIDPEHLPHIFDPFYRAEASRPVQSGGIGIGLSIVKMIVEAHDGRITVDSQPGRGTVFRIELPAAPTKPVENLSAAVNAPAAR